MFLFFGAEGHTTNPWISRENQGVTPIFAGKVRKFQAAITSTTHNHLINYSSTSRKTVDFSDEQFWYFYGVLKILMFHHTILVVLLNFFHHFRSLVQSSRASQPTPTGHQSTHLHKGIDLIGRTGIWCHHTILQSVSNDKKNCYILCYC